MGQDVPAANTVDKPSAADLTSENEELRAKLKAYNSLEEDLMSQKVFENAKKKITSWLTVGGLSTLVAGFIGFKQLQSYTKGVVDERIHAVSDAQVQEFITRRIAENVAARDQEIHTAILEVVGKAVLTQPLSYSQASNAVVEKTLSSAVLTDSTKATLDYTSSMSSIRDQGSEGSSVGFAVAAALEYQILKNSLRHEEVSPRFIYYAARKLEGQTKSDTGAVIADALKVISNEGAVSEQVWPYRAGEFSEEPPQAVATATHYKVREFYRLKASTEEVKAALRKYGPIVVGVPLYSSSQTAQVIKSGQIPDPEATDSVIGGFPLCIVGYDDAKKMFKFKNSWGSTWGDHGYGYVSYNYITKLSSDAYAIKM